MNLNSGVLDDIEDAPIVDNAVVVAPLVGQKPIGDPITVEVDMDDVKKEDTATDEDIAKLPSMDVSLKLVEDGQSKVLALKEVEQEILGQECISKDIAQYVSVSFESIFSGHVKLSEFTQSPSKTNFDYVKKHMKEAIALEEASLVSNFQLLLEQPLSDAKDAFGRILSSYIPTIDAQLFEMRALVLKYAEAIGNNKNSVFPNGDNTFINLATADFSAINKVAVQNKAALGNLVAIQKILTKPATITFVHAVNDAKAYPEAISTEFHPTYMGSVTTVQDLLKFYGSDVQSYVEHLEIVCAEQFSHLNELSEQVKVQTAVIDAEKNISLSAAMPGIQDAFTVLHRAMHLIQQLSLLNYNAKGFMEYISTL